MARQTGGAGYALINLHDVEYLKKVVSLVRWSGFPLRKPTPAGGGGGGYAQHGRLILGGEGGGGGTRGQDERYQAGFGEGFGGGQVGFALINAAWLRVYLLIGAGSVGQAFSASPSAAAAAAVNVGSVGPSVLVGLGVEVRLPLRHVRPLIGFHIGYRCALAERVFGDGSLELPPKKRGEPFFRLLFGLGIEG